MDYCVSSKVLAVRNGIIDLYIYKTICENPKYKQLEDCIVLNIINEIVTYCIQHNVAAQMISVKRIDGTGQLVVTYDDKYASEQNGYLYKHDQLDGEQRRVLLAVVNETIQKIKQSGITNDNATQYFNKVGDGAVTGIRKDND